jgi:hypothetical protein
LATLPRFRHVFYFALCGLIEETGCDPINKILTQHQRHTSGMANKH